MRCPICPAYLIVKRIYDVLFNVCDSCGHAEAVRKPEAA
jgi:DNA-directed RNA polymerase subunit M/transcription elongation factor TFIIS